MSMLQHAGRANLALAAAGLARMYSKGLPTEQTTDRLAAQPRQAVLYSIELAACKLLARPTLDAIGRETASSAVAAPGSLTSTRRTTHRASTPPGSVPQRDDETLRLRLRLIKSRGPPYPPAP